METWYVSFRELGMNTEIDQ